MSTSLFHRCFSFRVDVSPTCLLTDMTRFCLFMFMVNDRKFVRLIFEILVEEMGLFV